MRFIFRADASPEIGSGHVMRSSVLAEEAISRGLECIFVGEILGLNWVSERISKLGFSQVLSDQDMFVPDAVSDILILDSYSIPVSEPFISRKNWKTIMTITDSVTPVYETDVELRPGLTKVEVLPGTPTVLSGAAYVLVRKGIGKSKINRPSGGVLRVLVVGGGSDPHGFVSAIAEVVTSMKTDLEIHVFTNEFIIDYSGLKIVNHFIGSELDLIADCVDLVLTTASTLSLEFIARELPIGVACALLNQEDTYLELGRLGYAAQIGIRNSNGKWEFKCRELRELLESHDKRESLVKATNMLIDLGGAKRVIDKLISLAEEV